MDLNTREEIKALIEPAYYIKSDHGDYDKCLRILIPKFVISDSRPKSGKASFYNINKMMLMEIFNIVYEEDEILQNITLLGKYFVKLVAYIKPSQKVEKIFGMDLLASEIVECVAIKDNDNIEKVHYDVLQDEKFHIILDDSFISTNMTTKIWSYNPRVEILIYHENNKFQDKYLQLMMGMEKYKKFQCTRKALGANLSPELFWDRVLSTKIKNNAGSNNKLYAMLKNYTVDDLNNLIAYVKPTSPAISARGRNKKVIEIYELYLDLIEKNKPKRRNSK